MTDKNNIIAVYPGSFDPPTLGHIDIIKRAIAIFPKVIVAVVKNPGKKPSFTAEERLGMLRSTIGNEKQVEIDSFQGLLVDYVQKKKARVIVRGLRVISDFEYEFQMALMNRKLYPHIETIYLMPHEKYSYVSSSLVKEVARLGGEVGCLVPPSVEVHLKLLSKKRSS